MRRRRAQVPRFDAVAGEDHRGERPGGGRWGHPYDHQHGPGAERGVDLADERVGPTEHLPNRSCRSSRSRTWTGLEPSVAVPGIDHDEVRGGHRATNRCGERPRRGAQPARISGGLRGERRADGSGVDLARSAGRRERCRGTGLPHALLDHIGVGHDPGLEAARVERIRQRPGLTIFTRPVPRDRLRHVQHPHRGVRCRAAVDRHLTGAPRVEAVPGADGRIGLRNRRLGAPRPHVGAGYRTPLRQRREVGHDRRVQLVEGQARNPEDHDLVRVVGQGRGGRDPNVRIERRRQEPDNQRDGEQDDRRTAPCPGPEDLGRGHPLGLLILANAGRTVASSGARSSASPAT